jgi:transposase
MSRHASELTDEQWSKIEPLIPKRKHSKKGGRKRVEDRRCFEGTLWVLRSGARSNVLPLQYPSPATYWRRVQKWEDAGVWLGLWRESLGEIDEEGILSWDETFSDGTFSPVKKGTPTSARPNAERVQSSW